ncbi:YdcH family protein [Paremcibacter congregatus]|uniref:YdcH family protein n=2 Tax=Paremcibacter congregatus TaxID=2043170 RepID=UPI003A8CF43E|tara:strand:- start:2371 stop:2574 length:204 start_codon:yes stop_codon:yes gene_type:complete
MMMDDNEIVEKIQELTIQHRDLDMAIEALIESGKADVLQIQRLKKQKLHLRDRISHLESYLLPDIIA